MDARNSPVEEGAAPEELSEAPSEADRCAPPEPMLRPAASEPDDDWPASGPLPEAPLEAPEALMEPAPPPRMPEPP